MGMTPTQLYSVPQVCKAAQSLLDIHGEVGEEEVPMNVQEVTVRPGLASDARCQCHARDAAYKEIVHKTGLRTIRHASLPHSLRGRQATLVLGFTELKAPHCVSTVQPVMRCSVSPMMLYILDD